MQAIISKYLPATNARGARIKAKCERGSITTTLDHSLSDEAQHVTTVNALVARFADEDVRKYGSDRAGNPWLRPRVCGQLPSGEYVHTLLPTSVVRALNGAEDVLEKFKRVPTPGQIAQDAETVRGLVAVALAEVRK